MSFCARQELFGEGAVTYKLANQRPKFFVRSFPPQFQKKQFIDACLEAFGRWSAVCDVVFTPTEDPGSAQFLIFTKAFDGPSGILADCMLPAPGLRQQDLRLDVSERFSISDNPPAGMVSLLAVLAHEMGHGIGLSHFPPGPPPELMEPSLSSIVRPQQTEAAYAAKLYGPPQGSGSQPLPPVLGESLGLEVIITSARGERYVAKGNAKHLSG